MREILFRGKQTGSDAWVYGFYLYDELYQAHCIYTNVPTGGDGYHDPHVELARFEVIPETVGQFTGLTDKNGVKVFEGDIIHDTDWECLGAIEWYPLYLGWVVRLENGDVETLQEFTTKASTLDKSTSVVGNVVDNPELLKEE